MVGCESNLVYARHCGLDVYRVLRKPCSLFNLIVPSEHEVYADAKSANRSNNHSIQVEQDLIHVHLRKEFRSDIPTVLPSL